MELGLERKILKCFLIDKDFCSKYIEYITSDFFTNEVLIRIYDYIRKYFLKYKKLPTEEILLEKVLTDRLSRNEFEIVKSVEVDEKEWIDEQCKNFIMYNRLKSAITESIQILKRENYEDYEKIKNLIDNAFRISFDEKFYDYFSEEKIRERLEEDEVKLRYPTGISRLDVILEGGLGRGEMGIIGGVSGFGKSMLLQNFAVNCVLLGKKVLYYTFEEKEIEVAKRFDKIFTKMSSELIRLNKDKFVNELLKILREAKGKLLIKFNPPYSITPYTIKNDLESLMLKEDKINMVIVDYGQLLKSPQKYEQKWQELVYIYELLSSIALEFDIPLWTAVQLSKMAMKKETPDLLYVSGARDIVNCAQIVVMIAQNEEERREGIARLFIAKARRVGARRVIQVKFIYENMLVRDYVEADKIDELKESEKEEVLGEEVDVESIQDFIQGSEDDIVDKESDYEGDYF